MSRMIRIISLSAVIVAGLTTLAQSQNRPAAAQPAGEVAGNESPKIETDPYNEKALAAEMTTNRPTILYSQTNIPARPGLKDLPLKQSVSQYGITWTFQEPARVGRRVWVCSAFLP